MDLYLRDLRKVEDYKIRNLKRKMEKGDGEGEWGGKNGWKKLLIIPNTMRLSSRPSSEITDGI